MPGRILNSQSVGLCVVYCEVAAQPSKRADWRSLGWLPRPLGHQKVKSGALIIATTVHHQRHMIRVRAVVCNMAAERRSLDFGGGRMLALMPLVAENIGRRPRRKTILVEPCQSPMPTRQAV